MLALFLAGFVAGGWFGFVGVLVCQQFRREETDEWMIPDYDEFEMGW